MVVNQEKRKGTVSRKHFINFTTVKSSLSTTEKMLRVGAGIRRLDSFLKAVF